MKSIPPPPPPPLDFNAFSYLQSVLSPNAMLQTLEMSNEQLGRVLPLFHYYLMVRHFNHIANQSEKTYNEFFSSIAHSHNLQISP